MKDLIEQFDKFLEILKDVAPAHYHIYSKRREEFIIILGECENRKQQEAFLAVTMGMVNKELREKIAEMMKK